MIRVLVTQRFGEAQLDQLRAVSPELAIVYKPVRDNWSRTDTSSFFSGEEEILYCYMPPEDLAIAPRLKWIQLHSAGINQLTGHQALKSKLLITHSSGIHAVPIGEFSIALMLALARRLPRIVRMQEQGHVPPDRWNWFKGIELRGKTLGIVGYGSIGREAGRIAVTGLAMRVLAMTHSDSRSDHGYTEPGVGDPEGKLPSAWFRRDELLELLHQSDVVLIATPLTEDTRGMIGEKEFAR